MAQQKVFINVLAAVVLAAAPAQAAVIESIFGPFNVLLEMDHVVDREVINTLGVTILPDVAPFDSTLGILTRVEFGMATGIDASAILYSVPSGLGRSVTAGRSSRFWFRDANGVTHASPNGAGGILSPSITPKVWPTPFGPPINRFLAVGGFIGEIANQISLTIEMAYTLTPNTSPVTNPMNALAQVSIPVVFGFGYLFELYGDPNGDGLVSAFDFGLLAANFNGPGTWEQGDFNGDGLVGAFDFGLLASNFNSDFSGGASGQSINTIPEPSALVALVILVMFRSSI